MSPANPPSSPAINAYDDFPYPSVSFPQTHPNRLAAMGRLFGVPTPSPAAARVLELGCADGGNLLPMAENAPAATFLGIDAAKIPLEAGKKVMTAVGLQNVELRHQD